MRIGHRALFAATAWLSLLLGCAGPAGPTGPTGQAGESCTVTDKGNGSSDITCGGTTVTVKNGTSGSSCSVTANPDAGIKTITCTDGTTVTVNDGRPGVDANATTNFTTLTDAELSAADFSVTVQSISNDARPVVQFVVRDAKGAGVKGIPPADFAGIAVLQLVPGDLSDGGNGLGNDTWVSHVTNCATCTSSTETADSTSLVDHGDGSYTYTFKKDIINPTPYGDAGLVAIAGVPFVATAPHRFGMRLGVVTNAFRPVDAVYDYIPSTGANVTGAYNKVATANCLDCHVLWRANALNAGGAVPFHNGQRYEAQYCVICHNDQRKYSGNTISGNPVIAEPTINGNVLSNPDGGRVAVFNGEAIIDLPVWIHKIHRGDELYYQSAKTNAGIGTYPGESAAFAINDIGFPQDLRNCVKCHRNAAQADNWKSKPSRRACGACHDDVDFTNHQGLNHTSDRACVICHTAGGLADIAAMHRPVALPDPNNILTKPDGGNANTNASFLGSVLNPPAGARPFHYVMPTGAVTAVPLGDGGVNARVMFKLVEADGGNVVFNAPDAGSTELLNGFVGSPSISCAFAMPEDGVQPADFNVSISGYLKRIWNGTAAGANAGTLSGPDSNGYYTVTLTGVTIPPVATMLTCGLGYGYALAATPPSLPTPPLVETDVPGYPYSATRLVGGLSIPATNVWQVAVGYTGRRGATSSDVAAGQIVNTAKCAACHNVQLGVTPNYHAGQRNEAASCSFCHTPNRTSSGWSAGSESFVHGIHSAQFRNTPFNWHASSLTEGFYNTTYPGRLQFCESCHNAGYFDFSNAWYTDARLATRLVQTVATGVLASTDIALSPYVDAGVDYGNGWSYSASTQVVTEAAATTLVNSPITNVCFACHDGRDTQLHMLTNGGTIYGTRTQAKANVEQCLICHGPGKVAAIKDVHYK